MLQASIYSFIHLFSHLSSVNALSWEHWAQRSHVIAFLLSRDAGSFLKGQDPEVIFYKRFHKHWPKFTTEICFNL